MNGEAKIPLPRSLQEIVGALLFASPQPMTVLELKNAIHEVEPEEGEDVEVMEVYRTCTSREVEAALHGLEKELERSAIGMTLVSAGGQFRLQTSPASGRYVRAMLKLDKPSRLSRASLETLAIVAYRQPITKTEIEEIRGVQVDAIMKTLLQLGLVRLVGRSELPGHPFLYGTTPSFLDHFGLANLSELNAIDPTLQRSDPRERAKLFVKKEARHEDENQLELGEVVENGDKGPAPHEDGVGAEGPLEGGDEGAEGDNEDSGGAGDALQGGQDDQGA